MARKPRIALAGLPHLVSQRGNNRQPVFADRDDFQAYLACLRQVGQKRSLELHAYVLMPDHVHLLLTPPSDAALSAAVQDVGRTYVRAFNRRHGRSGTLWEGRFRSAVVDGERWLLAAMRYIETNPVRAMLVAEPADYPWSSYRHHAGLRIDPLITDHGQYWSVGNTPFERHDAYRRLADERLAPAELDALRAAVRSGLPLSGPQTVAAFEARGDAVPAPLPRGRPRKPVSGG
jgi:REP-associated tyrosine transposase